MNIINTISAIMSSTNNSATTYQVCSGEKDTSLIVLRGYPASGKSTFSRAWVSGAPMRAMVSRDAIREDMFGKTGVLSIEEENAITSVVSSTVTNFLNSGVSVVVDQTSLPRRYVKQTCQWGYDAGATVVVATMDTPLSESVTRNRLRRERGERAVPDEVIENMFNRFGDLHKQEPITMQDLSPEYNFAPYQCHNPEKNPVILFDIDGTLATMRTGEGVRSPYDWHRVGEDDVNEPVLTQLNVNRDAGFDIIIMSGRSEESRKPTEKWLKENGIHYDHLLMRAAGDKRKDSVVKRELLHIVEENFGEVQGVFDDRNQVVDMWRSIGLTVFQVNYGDF